MENLDISELFSSDQLSIGSSFGAIEIFLSLTITFAVAMFIYYVYKQTYNGVLYSKNYNITIVMTALIVNMIMIGISGNIVLSLGMVGALSIVRFRTAIKDPKDTAFIFWAITVGIINGVAFYELTIIASLFIAAVLFFFSQKSIIDPAYVLILKYRGDISETIEENLDEYCNKFYTRSDTRDGDSIEKVVEVRIKKNSQEELLNALRNVHGVEKSILLASNGDIAE